MMSPARMHSAILDDEPFAAAIYSEKNAKELISSILGTHFTLDFDAALENETVTGYIPDCTKREALQQIVFALARDHRHKRVARRARPEAHSGLSCHDPT